MDIQTITETSAAAYAAKKVLGPTLDVVGGDFKILYIKGRDLIINKASEKIKNINDGHRSNLRVSREVFWNGSFSDEYICAEYFGGILASSRSLDGKDDDSLYFVNTIKKLSSTELHLHYIIYNQLNKYFKKNDKKINIGVENEITSQVLFLDALDLCKITGFDISKLSIHLNILHKENLIAEYEHRTESPETSPKLRMKSYIKITPTTFGVTLYAVSHNRFNDWSKFSEEEFGDFKDVKVPNKHYVSQEDITTYEIVG